MAVHLVTFPLWLSQLRPMAQTGRTKVGLGGGAAVADEVVSLGGGMRVETIGVCSRGLAC